ncbi:hypothetical protein JAAARDRAFT_41770 [Jaapia argillacea MUCL 33604]|uniref:Uncharacterized protein n=1 Tax=Jaapia argillacea MUCL 33604 TaxID=933084 RepID=A0A067PA36_9AGAM|nr:hypothetical protein JAAARDRAFT_41770 [Jaapia argillacea MUCL 33604]
MNVVEESQKQYKPLAEEMITMRPRAKTITSAEAPGDMRKRSGDECRALKKRCVGRKKSVSHWAKEVAAQGEGQGTIRGGWFYDSAVSSVDVDASQLTLRARRQSIARMESIFSISQRMCEGNKTEATVSVLDADAMGRRRSIAMKRPFHA